jgi:DNA-binding transcriptional LysR family regulator
VITLPSENVALHAEPLCGADAVCVLPKDHRLREKTTIEATDLEGEALISIEPSTLSVSAPTSCSGGSGCGAGCRSRPRRPS